MIRKTDQQHHTPTKPAKLHTYTNLHHHTQTPSYTHTNLQHPSPTQTYSQSVVQQLVCRGYGWLQVPIKQILQLVHVLEWTECWKLFWQFAECEKKMIWLGLQIPDNKNVFHWSHIMQQMICWSILYKEGPMPYPKKISLLFFLFFLSICLYPFLDSAARGP